MEKTININLGGILFQIDEEAYLMLRDYLQAIDLKFRNVPGGSETIEDIEFRIAEIFQSQKTTVGVISKENVSDMIKIIGKPEDFDQSGDAPGAQEPVYSASGQRKRLFRNRDNSIFGGVCGGFGAYLNTDPVWIRLLFVVFTFFFGMGFFIYIALWIIMPPAETDTQKKEMYGGPHNPAMPANRNRSGAGAVGSAFDTLFRVAGKVLFVIMRIFLIFAGTIFVIGGFLTLLSFILIFAFQYPGSFSADAFGVNMAYLPDFLDYLVTPANAVWVKSLIITAVAIPMLMLIYGGIRLIFWFRARDGFVWLTGFVLWTGVIVALSLILFNEGIGFAKKEKVTSQEYFISKPDTLYIMTGKRISGLDTDKEIKIPDEEYHFYISEEKKEVYIRTVLDIKYDEKNSTSVEIRRHATGRSRFDARDNAERLIYNYSITGDTLFLDEYFTIPSGTKWSFDFIGVTVYVPEGTVINMDQGAEGLFHSEDDEDYVGDPEKSFWLMTDDGLDYIGHQRR